jgi:glycine cleavage system aminomethyltransferase T
MWQLQAKGLVERFQKYIFPMDKVDIQDISSRCGMLTLIGPGADELLQELGAVRLYPSADFDGLLSRSASPIGQARFSMPKIPLDCAV